jgi:hypothetical protein
MKQLIALSVVMLTSGCAVREANLHIFDNQRPATAAERAAILTDIKSTYLDPYSIRDAAISNAAPSMGLDGEITLNICVAANAKNGYGAYAGRQKTLYYLTSTARLARTNQDTFAQIFCDDQRLHYEPFAEAEQLRRDGR